MPRPGNKGENLVIDGMSIVDRDAIKYGYLSKIQVNIRVYSSQVTSFLCIWIRRMKKNDFGSRIGFDQRLHMCRRRPNEWYVVVT